MKMIGIANSLILFLKDAPEEAGIVASEWICATNWSSKLQALVSPDICREVYKTTIEESFSNEGLSPSLKQFNTSIRGTGVRLFSSQKSEAVNCLRFLFLLFEFANRRLIRSEAHFYAALNSCLRTLPKDAKPKDLQIDVSISIRRAVLKGRLLLAEKEVDKVEPDDGALKSMMQRVQDVQPCTEEALRQALNAGTALVLVMQYGSCSDCELTLLIELSGDCFYAGDACFVCFTSSASQRALSNSFERDLYPIKSFVLSIPGQEDKETLRRIKSEAFIRSMAKPLVVDNCTDPSMTFLVPYVR